MRIGLTFDEYVELKMNATLDGMGWLKTEPGKPPVFEPMVPDDEPPQIRMFPMLTVQASGHLRSRGYDCRPPMLDVLVKNGVIKLLKPDYWTLADVDAAADYFEEAGIRTPYADMCATLGCSYADFLRPLREAARQATQKYRRRIMADDQLFVMHRMPPRADAPAILTFTLCDDVRERLERGEEV